MEKTPLCQSEQVKQYIRQQREPQGCRTGHANEILAPAVPRTGGYRDAVQQGMGEGLIGLDGQGNSSASSGGGKVKSKKAVSAGLRPQPETAPSKRFSI
ncbi:hypothetical protein [Herbaspirillum sp. B65]|uniref:hypothetical protein n=1 Tax=Herbaspirillum sp. B65 TaxID=137708 RepID=UPI0011D18F0F|nr:hypothetical protein [Herbaspirillum sp. B65]